MKNPFNWFQAAIIKALTKSLFVDVKMVIPPKQVVANIQHHFGQIQHDGVRLKVGASFYAICVILGGPLFFLMSARLRYWLILRVMGWSRNNLMQDLARVRGVIYAGYYGHWVGTDEKDNLGAANPVLQQINFKLPADRAAERQQPGEVPLTRLDRDLPPGSIVDIDNIPDEVDVIVIGSGAGGAVSAANMAQKHHYEVLVVERGPYVTSREITFEERAMTAKLFVQGALQSTDNNDIVLFQGRCVGGSTLINNGICLRVQQPGSTHPDAEDVYATWQAMGASVDVNRFNRAYVAVERGIDMHSAPSRTGRHNGQHLIDGWNTHCTHHNTPKNRRAPNGWFDKNFGSSDHTIPCAYCGYCNTGCHFGRKNAMVQTFLQHVGRDNKPYILPDTKALHIQWHPTQQGRAEAVEVRLKDGSHRVIKVRKGVIVAGGTLASSRFLTRSGVPNTGNDISLNIACPVVALMPDEPSTEAWNEDQMSSYVDHGDFLLESHFQPPMSMSTLMPGWGADHAARMQNYNRLTSAGILFPADRRGRIADNALHFTLRDDVEIPLLRRALATLTRVHFAAGALEVYPALTRGQTITRDMDIDAFFEDAIREADDVTLSSSHLQGGNPRNSDPNKGVVDLDCRVHGTENILVTDASVFSSCIRVNAQLTTMAMAYYATENDPF